jgi:ribosomal-protein-alanine N-acetyltransferase
MPEVLAIEKESFEFPWSEDDFLRQLRQRNSIGMVADIDDKVAGYMIYELAKSRLRLVNMAVAPEIRRQGIGTQMIEKLASKLSRERRSQVALAVRESNLPAQLFFRDCGFKAVNTLRHHYDDTPEDAYDMRLRFLSTEQKIVRTINQLERLTGVQWELVQKDDQGRFARCDLETADEQCGLLALRPRITLRNAEAACTALNAVGGFKAEIGWNHDKPEELMLPVQSISDMQIRHRKDRELVADFQPADKQGGHANRLAKKVAGRRGATSEGREPFSGRLATAAKAAG